MDGSLAENQEFANAVDLEGITKGWAFAEEHPLVMETMIDDDLNGEISEETDDEVWAEECDEVNKGKEIE
eukprot:CAMPEP_0197834572 /NCGR_PEP_ID=MMETSP1437-20131217/22888_1 /TAXON_ID=49252 ORGANISM="Eucampia antarctica, Strain CCMP1452" /NCGR_SAMPLE_ID=MMETSP1437 /ASSEMBLY_ACC=CAM_ASM_001096 /LENGTH=69 /DNA_ID=CAMNT_0043439367 /DNA_START=608 /DNA_END=817 /DNA_ORIENTATION=+